MISAQSLLTKHRPQTFDELVGQADAVAAFKTAADNGSHVFLFYGGSGTGKTTTALLGAEYVGARQLIEVNGAAANGVDEMRELTAAHGYHLVESRAVILDECQRLTAPAWTILLKPLEEPPAELFWFLCTTDLARIPENIRTRCISIHLQDVGRDELQGLLTTVVRREEWSTPRPVIALCAQEARGAPRRALSFLAACSRCTTREEAARLINVTLAADTTEEGLGYSLARALRRPQWAEIRPLLKTMLDKSVHPESVRRVVCAYYTTVISNSKDERVVCYAASVLEHFLDR
jgi:DNA polymerase-3 subunit gamma/tau